MPSLKQDLEVVENTIVKLQSIGDLDEVDRLFTCLGIKTKAAKEFIRLALSNALLMDRKQQDYGPKNISSFGTFGVMVRMNDKMERLKTLFGTGKRKAAKNESIQDSLRDISNYAIIALLIELDRWPNE